MSDISEHRRRLALRAGRTAYERGKPITANNRQPGTIYSDDWHDGFEEARNHDPKRGALP